MAIGGWEGRGGKGFEGMTKSRAEGKGTGWENGRTGSARSELN